MLTCLLPLRNTSQYPSQHKYCLYCRECKQQLVVYIPYSTLWDEALTNIIIYFTTSTLQASYTIYICICMNIPTCPCERNKKQITNQRLTRWCKNTKRILFLFYIILLFYITWFIVFFTSSVFIYFNNIVSSLVGAAVQWCVYVCKSCVCLMMAINSRNM